ncbi:ATP-grasp domain-containing protein [Costertonia aggregata]|uniref:Prokaryotic glutathione synthetase ATP-binding domain-containing protein n=1 Tax=Costertonia aggregata TaxID=343403 RepID=A0A7H9AU29_9FLAO|nr:hypothetical protein [Costertonia aggregata]QLG47001.1 hypothetical protein HYG79_17110 [Costertonia aggregata]
MQLYDIVILTDRRYINAKETNTYIKNLLLEDRLVFKALEQQGLKVARKAWDDPCFDWNITKCALFRTTWDYFDRYVEFSHWLKSVSSKTQLINSKELLHWNIDKHYLQDLANKGVNIPKTLFIEKGQKHTLHKTVDEAIETLDFTCNDYILKPCVSGAARHTYKMHKSEISQHEAIFQKLISSEALMLQEFQKNIVAHGEVSMMIFEGIFTHAVLKVAKAGDFRVQDDFGGSVHTYDATKDEIAFAKKVVAACPELPLYARVDIFRDNMNKLALAELEIFEPELWFRYFPKAATILAQSIKRTYFS